MTYSQTEIKLTLSFLPTDIRTKYFSSYLQCDEARLDKLYAASIESCYVEFIQQ